MQPACHLSRSKQPRDGHPVGVQHLRLWVNSHPALHPASHGQRGSPHAQLAAQGNLQEVRFAQDAHSWVHKPSKAGHPMLNPHPAMLAGEGMHPDGPAGIGIKRNWCTNKAAW